jgi:osmotically-inducible protein OsmY
MLRTDAEIQKDVTDELKYDPSLQDDDVAIAVRDGVVTLAGYVKSYLDKWHAERVASRVKGVRAVVNDLEVHLPTSSERPDPELARAAVEALRWNVAVPADRIKVKVEKGWVTLEGDVDWYFQREAATRAVRSITGVRGITNLITVKAPMTQPSPDEVKRRIKDTLARGAQFDADRIQVEVQGHRAVLTGTVRSYAERRDAERAALNAPGITDVENHIIVDPNVFAAV